MNLHGDCAVASVSITGSSFKVTAATKSGKRGGGVFCTSYSHPVQLPFDDREILWAE